MKVLNEWTLQAPWGNIALISWGNPTGYPILLVHGRQDSVSTFEPLLELMPEHYHYIGMDLPGHGKSDAFPVGVKIMRFAHVTAVDFVVKNLKLSEFYYIGHSMGTELGCFYNAIYPNRIKKIVHFDPVPALRKIQIRDLPSYMTFYFHEYYDDYKRQNVNNRVYSKDEAVKAVCKSRGVSKMEAEVLLSRNLIKVGLDQYLLSWDRRTKEMATLNFDDDYYFELFTKNCPPTLLINALNTHYPDGKEATFALAMKIKNKVGANYFFVSIDGDHDLHIKQPNKVVKYVLDFLAMDFCGVTSKL